MRKLMLIGAAAAGYVLGTKAGRERYEQIKRQTSKLWNSGPVQHGVQEAETAAKHAASTAGSKVAAKVKGDDEPTARAQERPATNGVPASPSVPAVEDPPG